MPGYVRERGKRKDGSTKWQARYWNDGRRIERGDFRSKREAVNWLTRQGAAALDGTHIDPRRGDTPLAEVADAWRDTWEAKRLQPRTRAGYESILSKHVLPAFGKRPVASITGDDVQRFVNRLGASRAPNTVQRIYGVLLQVLAFAVKRRYITISPCASIELGAAPDDKPQLFLTPAEVRALAAAMPERYRLPTLIAAYCGLRAGELWALRRRDIDLLHGTLRVERALKDVNSSALADADKGLIFGPTKTRQTRSMVIPAPLVPLLADHLAGWGGPGNPSPDALLFPSPTGRPVRHNEFYRRTFRPAVRALWPEGHRLHRLRWHDLRHTCAALSLAVTPDLHAVKERLGHKDIHTTINIYGHLLPEKDQALADGLGALFTAAAAAEPDNPNVVPLRAGNTGG